MLYPKTHLFTHWTYDTGTRVELFSENLRSCSFGTVTSKPCVPIENVNSETSLNTGCIVESL